MKRVAVLVGVLLILTALPTGIARHLSVGAQETVGVTARETPASPSVPGPDGDEDHRDTPYERAVRTDCFEPERHDTPSAQELQEGASSDSLCGKLVYHPDSNYTQVSDPDQQLNGPIGQFDVVRTSTTDVYGLTYCYVFCTRIPGSTTAWNAFHDLGCELDLTRCSEEVDDADREQRTFLSLRFPGAAGALQNQTGLWVGDGWVMPTISESFVAFLYDDQGRLIDDERLDAIYETYKDQLPANNGGPMICGFTPSYDLEDIGFCDIKFQFYSEGDSPTDGGDFKSGDNDACDSPTYTCGATQPFWGSRTSCIGTLCTGSDLENPYKRFHWVVAPTISDCTGAQDPGVSFDTPSSLDYLAHDVDVYTLPTAITPARDTTSGLPNAYASVDEDEQVTENPPTPTLGLTAQALLAPLPPLPPEVDKDQRVEPNAERDAAKMTGLEDESQDPDFTVPRSPAGGCAAFTGEAEPAYAVDPWVNIIDMDRVFTDSSTLFHPRATDKGAYGTSADNQDHTNHGTRGLVWTEGNVGFYTDKNDNGLYDRLSPGNQFSEIETAGAYPLFWDLWLKNAESDPEIDTEASCTPRDSSKSLSALMKEAGYGIHTGLVQAVYLEESTTFVDVSSSSAIPFPSGQNIYLMKSQAMHALGQADDPRIKGFLDRIVDGLRSHPDIPDDATVVDINDAFGIPTAFDPQCLKYTGGFWLDVSFVHNCEVSCEGDTIVTGYMLETTKPDNSIGSPGASGIPLYAPGDETFSFPSDVTTWTDVDPFDNNPQRNDPLSDDEKPTHHPPDADPPPEHHD